MRCRAAVRRNWPMETTTRCAAVLGPRLPALSGRSPQSGWVLPGVRPELPGGQVPREGWGRVSGRRRWTGQAGCWILAGRPPSPAAPFSCDKAFLGQGGEGRDPTPPPPIPRTRMPRPSLSSGGLPLLLHAGDRRTARARVWVRAAFGHLAHCKYWGAGTADVGRTSLRNPSPVSTIKSMSCRSRRLSTLSPCGLGPGGRTGRG